MTWKCSCRMLKISVLLTRQTPAVFYPPALSFPGQTLRHPTSLVPSKAAASEEVSRTLCRTSSL
jgi:hypothetical protein